MPTTTVDFDLVWSRVIETIKELRCAEPRVINADLLVSEGILENDKDTDGNYFNNDNCTWIIAVPPGMILRFSFEYVATSGCSDFVAVYDGPSLSAPLLTKQCMFSGPSTEDFNSSPGVEGVLVQFHTDSFLTNLGFKMSWELSKFFFLDQPNSNFL